jgi:hypothetical protein
MFPFTQRQRLKIALEGSPNSGETVKNIAEPVWAHAVTPSGTALAAATGIVALYDGGATRRGDSCGRPRQVP